MALGDITRLDDATHGDHIAVEILASATATNSPPATATAGVSMVAILDAFGGVLPPDMRIVATSTAGSATMSVTLRLWEMFGTLASQTNGLWSPPGVGADSVKGLLNGGVAIGEVTADVIRHSEVISLGAHASRVYVEITAIGGTATAITVFLVGRKHYALED